MYELWGLATWVRTSAPPHTNYLQICDPPWKFVFDFNDSSLLVSLLSLWLLDLGFLCMFLFHCLSLECLCSPSFCLKLFFSLFTFSVRICKIWTTVIVPAIIVVSSKIRHVESFTQHLGTVFNKCFLLLLLWLYYVGNTVIIIKRY